MKPYECQIKINNHTSFNLVTKIEDNREEVIIHIYEVKDYKSEDAQSQ